MRRNDRHNLLRPETAESLYFVGLLTGKPRYRRAAWDMCAVPPLSSPLSPLSSLLSPLSSRQASTPHSPANPSARTVRFAAFN